MLMMSIAKPILLQLQLMIINYRRAVPALITSSPLIGIVQMTQKIRESMLDITFRPRLSQCGYKRL
jgi:hypothetical protein